MIWKDVVGYEGIYEVSDSGQVRTHKNKVTHSTRHGKRKWKQRILKQKVTQDRTCRVSLYKNKQEKTWLVHRLVALAFIEKVEGKDFINHKDGNRLNNTVDNLEWCDHKENNNHAFETGLMTTNQQVILLNKKTKESHYFRSKVKASEFLGRNRGFVSRLLKRKQNEYEDYIIFIVADKENL